MFLAPIQLYGLGVPYQPLAPKLTVCSETTATESVQKPKKIRTNYTQTQIEEFEKVFMQNRYPSHEMIEKLSETLNIPVGKMKTWFQNKRSRQRKAKKNNICSETDTGLSSDCQGQGSTVVSEWDSEEGLGTQQQTPVHQSDSGRGIHPWSTAPPTHTPTTNQACMNYGSQTVYSILYHRPLMTPRVLKSPWPPADDVFPQPPSRDSSFGSQQAVEQHENVQMARPAPPGYTSKQATNQPYMHQYGTAWPYNQGSMWSPSYNQGNINTSRPLSWSQTGGYDSYKDAYVNINSYSKDRNTQIPGDNAMFTVFVDKNRIPALSDDNFNPMYDFLFNGGQIQFSSYHMQLNTNATQRQQNYGSLDNNFNPHVFMSQYHNGNSAFASQPQYNDTMEQQYRVPTTYCNQTAPPTEPYRNTSSIQSWQCTQGRNVRFWNTCHCMPGTQPHHVDILRNSIDENPAATFINEMADCHSMLNPGYRHYIRPETEGETNMVQTPTDYILGNIARSGDNDIGSLSSSQDADTDSLESFESGHSIEQIDMTASIFSELGPYSPLSPESFRGDTPHPDLWSMDWK
ncbi:uncharacterized protein [Argopecten irradians]|uniref:uncharacterized protein isoform X2 n=1 Tax=Argopecten irradians TaxID=31199 RepID=UPI00372204ED